MDLLIEGMKHLNVETYFKSTCCNDSSPRPCGKPGPLACKGCLMITYCSRQCQREHWPSHRADCQSRFMKDTWRPAWVVQCRPPSFTSNHVWFEVFGTPKFLWGNFPALDVIQLRQNEGVDYKGPLSVLFAGDMRNVIFSVLGLPDTYKGSIDMVINDRDIAIVARNLIFLLIFLTTNDADLAADCVLHVWYSALITKPCHVLLRAKIRPFVHDVCRKIAHKAASIPLAKTWRFGGSSLRLVLTRDRWFALLAHFDVPLGLSGASAQILRHRVVCAPERVDYVDRALCSKTPTGRMAMMKFREDGILLPFGQSRAEFIVPNPTLFHSHEEWPMLDDADPRSGWSSKLIPEARLAKNDVYGSLHYYLKGVFASFHRRIRSTPVSIELLNVDAVDLPLRLAPRRFSRVDAGNIGDKCYVGIHVTLGRLGPLLQAPSVNPHATLITLFMNAVAEMKAVERQYLEDHVRVLRKVMGYLPGHPFEYIDPTNPNYYKLIGAMSLVYDVDRYFDQYMMQCGFPALPASVGLEMKTEHTIIDAWPLRVTGTNGITKKIKEDFATLMASSHTGQERIVEWKFSEEKTSVISSN